MDADSTRTLPAAAALGQITLSEVRSVGAIAEMVLPVPAIQDEEVIGRSTKAFVARLLPQIDHAVAALVQRFHSPHVIVSTQVGGS